MYRRIIFLFCCSVSRSSRRVERICKKKLFLIFKWTVWELAIHWLRRVEEFWTKLPEPVFHLSRKSCGALTVTTNSLRCLRKFDLVVVGCFGECNDPFDREHDLSNKPFYYFRIFGLFKIWWLHVGGVCPKGNLRPFDEAVKGPLLRNSWIV